MAESDEKMKKREQPRIDIFRAWCKACGICVAFCPTRTLEKDEAGYPYVVDIDRCISCGWCELRCPDFAITVEPAQKRRRTGEKGEEQNEAEAKPERTVTTG